MDQEQDSQMDQDQEQDSEVDLPELADMLYNFINLPSEERTARFNSMSDREQQLLLDFVTSAQEQASQDYLSQLHTQMPELPEYVPGALAGKACGEVKTMCESEVDPLLMEDWCDVDAKEYALLDTQCFTIGSLIQSFEAGLSQTVHGVNNPKYPENPLTRVPVGSNVLLQLAAQHIYAGNTLPPHLSHLIWGILNEQDTSDLKAFFGMA